MFGKQKEGSSCRNLKESFTYSFSTFLLCTCSVPGKHVISVAGGTSVSKMEIRQDFKGFVVKSREGGGVCWGGALSFLPGQVFGLH